MDGWDSSSSGLIFVVWGFAPKNEKKAPREEEEELVVVEPGETGP